MKGYHPPAIFVGDALALDFLNSIATPKETTLDWIGDGVGYLQWLVQARLVPGDTLRNMQAHALPGEIDRVAEQARDLREWFRGFTQRHKGEPLKAEALSELAPLNRLLERDEAFSRIVPSLLDGRPFQLQTVRRWRSPDSLLLPVAHAVADLVCTGDFSYVKACEAAACTLLFADHTRGHARRWCSMAICGNRAKQANHRQRLSAQRSSAEKL